MDALRDTDKPFAIICYKIGSLIISDYTKYEYCKLRLANGAFAEIDISEQKAKELIKQHNMIEVLVNEYGRVWELADSSYRAHYRFYKKQVKI